MKDVNINFNDFPVSTKTLRCISNFGTLFRLCKTGPVIKVAALKTGLKLMLKLINSSTY